MSKKGLKNADVKMRKLSKSELAYIAGIFDGEGSLFVNQGSRNRTIFTITQGVHGIQMLKWLKKKTGVGSIVLHRGAVGNWQEIYRFKIYSTRLSIELVRRLYPFLLVKKAQVRKML